MERKKRHGGGQQRRTFLNDLESLLGELFAGKGLRDGRHSQAFASVLLLIMRSSSPSLAMAKRKEGGREE